MGKLRMTLGKDPKDKSKQVLLSASLDRTIKDWTNVNMDYKMRALAPMLVSAGRWFSVVVSAVVVDVDDNDDKCDSVDDDDNDHVND